MGTLLITSFQAHQNSARMMALLNLLPAVTALNLNLFSAAKPPAPTVPYYGGAFEASEVGATGLPGDVGFHPLGLANFDLLLDSATDKQRSAALVMRDYRDAELKHGRLAMCAASDSPAVHTHTCACAHNSPLADSWQPSMFPSADAVSVVAAGRLAAVAFPLQEKLNPILAAKFHMPNLVAETGGLSPSVLNGGLEQGIIPSSIVVFAVLMSLVEAQGLRIKEAQGDAWMPGDYGTLRIAERGTEQFISLAEGEIWNARIAMIAILAYVVQEYVTGIPTALTIPFLGF